MKPLNLDCLTLPDTAPADLVRVAARAGYASVSLWVQAPALYGHMLATPDMEHTISAALAETGVAVGNLEVFNLNTEGPIEDYRSALEFGARLGARGAVAMNFGPPRSDLAERFAAFQRLCAEAGLDALLEPISMSEVRTIEDGVRLIAEAGVPGQLVVDMLHVMRTGGGPANLAAVDPRYIGHVQICDGPALVGEDRIGIEATADRMYPGEGDFPITDFLRHVPAHATVGLEAPNQARLERGMSPLERAAEGMAMLRRLPGLSGANSGDGL